MLSGLLLLAMTTPLETGPIRNPLQADPTLDAKVREVVEEALVKFKDRGIKPDSLSVSFVEIDRASPTQRSGGYRADERFYPASVVKAFYLAYAHRQLQDRKIKMSPEFQRALDDMIKDSSNDATHHVMDVVTGTTAGPELSEGEMKKWSEKRQSVNRWLQSLGYTGQNACQKTWCEGPYGRERAFLGPNYENRNKLTTAGTARLFTEIALGTMVNPKRSEEMRTLLTREIPADSDKADAQSRNYSGKILPKGSGLWSKAGWTDTARHDAAYVKLPDGQERVVVVYTYGLATVADLIPFIAQKLLGVSPEWEADPQAEN